MYQLRLLCDPPLAGDWNMAVDEALLEAACTGGVATLRFYQWEQATVSLGYFQAIESRNLHVASSACPIVRRASGGGAIVHDRELTYSVAVPLADAHWTKLAKAPLELYETFHGTLVATLSQRGLDATQNRDQRTAAQGNEPFLCFQRRSEGDVLFGTHKIGGSAQRRVAGAVLQHGSVLLERSSAAPELPGIGDLAGRPLTGEELREAWLAKLAEVLNVKFCQHSLAKTEFDRAKYWRTSRFRNLEWLSRR